MLIAALMERRWVLYSPSGGLGASLTKMALPLWMATTLVVGGSFRAQYLARQVEPL
jgi:hypothetical protein